MTIDPESILASCSAPWVRDAARAHVKVGLGENPQPAGLVATLYLTFIEAASQATDRAIAEGIQAIKSVQDVAVEELRVVEAERDTALKRVETMTITQNHTCTCPNPDPLARIIDHEKDCPVRVNLRTRLAPEVAMDRLAAALHSGDEVDELKAEIERLTRNVVSANASLAQGMQLQVALTDAKLKALADRDAAVADRDAAHAGFRRAIAAINAALAAAGFAPIPGVGGRPTIDCLRDLVAERDAYRAMVADLLASAFPNERDHPTMSKAWARARELLKNGKLNEPTAEQRKQEASIYLEEGLAEVAKMQAERDEARKHSASAADEMARLASEVERLRLNFETLEFEYERDTGSIPGLRADIERMRPVYDAALDHRRLFLTTGQRSTKLDEAADATLREIRKEGA